MGLAARQAVAERPAGQARGAAAPPAERPPLAIVEPPARGAAARPALRVPPPSLRTLVPGVATLILALSMLIAARVAEDHSRGLLVRELEARLVSEARQVALAASTALLDDFPELRLAPALRDFAGGRPDVVDARVLDVKERVRGHLEARRIGEAWAPDPTWRPVTTAVRLRDGERVLGNDATLAVITPVVHASGKRIGTAVVAIRRLEMRRAIEASRRTQGLLLLGVLAVGAAAMLVLMRGLVAPVASLRRGLERIGRGELDARLEPAGASEFRMLSETLNSMSARLRVAQTEALERERLAGEMEIAATIQRSLLPAGRFVSGGFVLAGAQRPAAEVGGDYFDFLTRSDGRLALVMADVSGKGVGGALMMSMLASTVRAFFPSSACASDLLVVIEKQLGPQLDRRSFITVWHGVLDPETGRVEHASAGHLPSLVVRARDGKAEWIRGRAVPIGISGPGGLRAQLDSAETVLEPGDLLVQLTDGVTEAFDPDRNEQFGFGRVEAVVLRHAREGPDAVVKAIFEAVSAWTGGAAQDDETVLVVWRDPAAANRLVPTPHSVDDVMALVESFGVHLRLPAEIPQLAGLRGWLLEQPVFAAMPADHRQRMELALYELAANTLEHGYRRHEEGALDLWWIPDDPAAPPPPRGSAAAAGGPDGFFVLRDHGRPFDPGRGLAPDFGDPATRRQGRGLGLALARRLATRIRYYPNTTYGNLTLLRIEPQRNPEVGDVG